MNILLSLIGILSLFMLEDKTEAAGWAIVLLILWLLLFIKKAVLSPEKFFSPISMLVFFGSLYSIMGVTMWLYREINFTNWDGQFWDVLYIFVVVDFFLTFFGIFILDKQDNRIPNIDRMKLQLKRVVFLVFLVFEYIGIYLFTAGFKIIPLLASDIDEARFELGELDRPGAGIGTLLINFGIFCIIHIYYLEKSLYIKLLLFLIVYFPFILYGGRFLMVIPLILIAVMFLVRKIREIKFGFIVKTIISVFVAFFAIMFYGTFRKAGSDIETDFVIDFITSDLFPEFRGSVGAYSLNDTDLSLDYIGFMLTSFFPGSLLTIIGIDKSSQISIGSYVAQLLGFDGHFGVRISFTGELLLTNPITFFAFWFLYLKIVLWINKIYFNTLEWNYNKLLMAFFGLSLGAIIPYGITLLPNTIIMIVVFSLVVPFVIKKTIGKTKLC